MFIDNLKNELNYSITENGALGYKTTNKDIVDFNFKISSYRNKTPEQIRIDFKKVWYEDKELALKLLFYIRDVRGGAGERRLFRICLNEISSELDERVFDWIEEYGRLDDIFCLYDSNLHDKLITWVQNKLISDLNKMKNNEPISLLAKWMPSINTSSKITKALANKLCKDLELTHKEYRITLSKLRNYSNVIEPKLCKNEWDKVDYEKVPSIANLKYMNAFLKHDKNRREQYLEALAKGETKINTAVTFPHSIVSKYREESKLNPTLEGMWKALPDYVQGNSKILVVRDGSGSMTCRIDSKSKVQALDVSTALAIYFSEHQEGQFKDQFITFSAYPQVVSLTNYETLRDKLNKCMKESDCTNTNLEKVFDLVLQTAVKNNLSQEEIPDLLIISDMEFDYACSPSANSRLFNIIENKFKNEGYKLPKLIFWNVNSRSTTIPVIKNDLGVILVSGFSPAVVKMVLTNELDPYKALLSILLSERYKQVSLNKE